MDTTAGQKVAQSDQKDPEKAEEISKPTTGNAHHVGLHKFFRKRIQEDPNAVLGRRLRSGEGSQGESKHGHGPHNLLCAKRDLDEPAGGAGKRARGGTA